MKSIYLPLAMAFLTAAPIIASNAYADTGSTTQPSDSQANRALAASDQSQPDSATQGDAPTPPSAIQGPTGDELQVVRVDGGGVRGGSASTCSTLNLVASVVAPSKGGTSSMATHFQSPKLIFFLSLPTSDSVRVAIREEAPKGGIGATPLEWLSDANGPRKLSEGLHMIDLSTCGVQLKPGVVYRWSVSLPSSLDDLSKQNETWGRIKYDASVSSDRSFYDNLARNYNSLLSNPADSASLSQIKKLLADQDIHFCDSLKTNAVEPPCLENTDSN